MGTDIDTRITIVHEDIATTGRPAIIMTTTTTARPGLDTTRPALVSRSFLAYKR